MSDALSEELDSIEAIYGNCFTKVTDTIIALTVPEFEDFTIRLSFVSEYPDSKYAPNVMSVKSARPFDKQNPERLRKAVEKLLHSVYKQGQVCIFDFISSLQQFLPEYMEQNKEDVPDESIDDSDPWGPTLYDMDKDPNWFRSDPVYDRGSTFLAFARKIDSVHEALKYIQLVPTDAKMAKASHVMWAYRIVTGDGQRLYNHSDDGEKAAGSRMYHLMNAMDVSHCLLMCVRFFKGTHIGSDRFRHINSTSQQALIRGKFGKVKSKK